MLPFLKRQQEAAIAVPIETKERKPDQEQEYDGLESCMEELISAIHAKDSKGAAEAFKAAFEVCESEPHYEGEHT